jgi:hypothetical protein
MHTQKNKDSINYVQGDRFLSSDAAREGLIGSFVGNSSQSADYKKYCVCCRNYSLKEGVIPLTKDVFKVREPTQPSTYISFLILPPYGFLGFSPSANPVAISECY